jgi:hypothetical protein
MNAAPQMLRDARDLLFADWAQPIELRSVTRTYNAETGTAEESLEIVTVDAIRSPMAGASTPGTAGGHASDEAVFLVRDEDLPAEWPLLSSRVAFDETEFVVLRMERHVESGMVTLHTRSLPTLAESPDV